MISTSVDPPSTTRTDARNSPSRKVENLRAAIYRGVGGSMTNSGELS